MIVFAGERPGPKSYEADPFRAGPRRMKEVEAELKVVKVAGALFEKSGCQPKRSTRLSDG